MKELILKPSGLLEYKKWNTDTLQYDVEELSDIASSFLNEYITLDNIVLKDLFLLIEKNIDIFEIIFRQWIREYTAAVLYGTPELKKDGENDVDYLELYWNISIDDEGIHVPGWPEFHGIGIAKFDDAHYKAGDIIKWGIGLSPMQNYANTPLVLKATANVNITDKHYKTISNNDYPTESYTLYQIIQGVMYEMSFHGSPSDSLDLLEDLKDQMKRIESGEERMYSMDEVFSNIKNRFDNDSEE